MIPPTKRQRNTLRPKFCRILRHQVATQGSSTAAHVLLLLLAHADAAGKSELSQRTIASKTGLSPRTIRKATRELEDKQLLRVTRGTGHDVSSYEILGWESDDERTED